MLPNPSFGSRFQRFSLIRHVNTPLMNFQAHDDVKTTCECQTNSSSGRAGNLHNNAGMLCVGTGIAVARNWVYKGLPAEARRNNSQLTSTVVRQSHNASLQRNLQDHQQGLLRLAQACRGRCVLWLDHQHR